MSTPQQTINLGTAPDSGTGEPLRDAFAAVNNNFANIWAAGPVDSNVQIANNRISTTGTNQDLDISGNGLANIRALDTLQTLNVQPLADGVYALGTANAYYDSSYVRYHLGSTVSVTGNITGEYFIGNGSQLTGITGGATGPTGPQGAAGATGPTGPAGGGGGANLGNLTISNVTIGTAASDQSVIIAPVQTYQPWWYSIYGDLGTNINDDYGEGIAYDSDGNIYVVGGDSNLGIVSFLVKYNSAGVVQWQKTFDLDGHYKSGESIAVDGENNVYVTIKDWDTGYIYLVKVDGTGSVIWQRQIQTAASDWSGNLAVDSGNNIYVVANSSSPTRYLLKFSSDGTLAWQVETIGNNGQGIAIDSLDNIYVGDSPLTKYDSAGNVIWQIDIAGISGNNDIDTDSSGNTYLVIGSLVQKIDASGQSVWQANVPGISFYAVAVDPINNSVIASGVYFNAANSSNDLGISSFDATTGAVNWANGFGSMANETQYYYYGTDFLAVNGSEFATCGLTRFGSTGPYNALILQSSTSGVGQGIYGSFEYYLIAASSTVTAGSTSTNTNVNQPSSLTVDTGVLNVSNNSYTDSLVEFSPGGAKTFSFGPGGSLTFPNDTSQNTALESGMDFTFSNVVAETLSLNSYKIALAQLAGQTNQGNLSVAIGWLAGTTNQGTESVAIGSWAGAETQGSFSVAIGRFSGQDHQGNNSVAIGLNAGYSLQSANAVSMGTLAGAVSQGARSVAVGFYAGRNYLGIDSVAIGTRAGYDSQANNSIVLNATGNTLNNTTANTFVVKPVRAVSGGVAPVGFSQVYYNPTTGEFIVVTA